VSFQLPTLSCFEWFISLSRLEHLQSARSFLGTVIPRAAAMSVFRIETSFLRRGGSAVSLVIKKADPPGRISLDGNLDSWAAA
jgi:hypothetical protein